VFYIYNRKKELLVTAQLTDANKEEDNSYVYPYTATVEQIRVKCTASVDGYPEVVEDIYE
jgi:hypothetical protein